MLPYSYCLDGKAVTMENLTSLRQKWMRIWVSLKAYSCDVPCCCRKKQLKWKIIQVKIDNYEYLKDLKKIILFHI